MPRELLLCCLCVAARASRYVAHHGPVTWRRARDRCIVSNRQLAVVRSSTDQADLVAALNDGRSRLPYAGNGPKRQGAQYWIGAADSGTGWTWTDGSAVSFTAWGHDQPTVDAGNEDCVAVLYAKDADDQSQLPKQVQWSWHGVSCGVTLDGFVCSPPSPPHPPSPPAPPGSPPRPPAALPSPVPPGGTAHYFLSTAMTSPDPGLMQWSTASGHCASLGLQLAIIRTAADQAAFEAVLREAPIRRSMYWVGARLAAVGGRRYEWTDGTPLIGEEQGGTSLPLSMPDPDMDAVSEDHVDGATPTVVRGGSRIAFEPEERA